MKMVLDLQFEKKSLNKNIMCTCSICRNTSFIVKMNQFWHAKLRESINIQEYVNDTDKYVE